MITETIAKLEVAIQLADQISPRTVDASTHLQAAIINLKHAKELFETHLECAEKAPAATAPFVKP